MTRSLLFDVLLATGPAGIVAKATLVLVFATLIASVSGRASAAARHLVWFAALVACCALPLFTLIGPPIAVMRAAVVSHPEPIVTSMATAPTSEARTPRTRIDHEPNPSRYAVSSPSISSRPTASAWLRSHFAAIAVGLWTLGALLVLSRLLIGLLGTRRVAMRSVPLVGRDWVTVVSAATNAVGARVTPHIVVDEEIAAPITFGFAPSTIVLPMDALTWTDERRYVVLVHEMAHVVRADFAVQIVANVVSALFWFHPLVWLANARLRAEAERAADDCVIASGTAGVTYASHLLDIARDAGRSRMELAAAVGMVRPFGLESRFRAMLDGRRSRATIPTQLRIATTTGVALAMIPVSGLRSVTQSIAAQTGPAPITLQTRTTPIEERTSVTQDCITSNCTIDQSIDATPGRRLILDLVTGASVKVHAWTSPRVHVRGHIGGRDSSAVEVSLERTGDDVRLRSRVKGLTSSSTNISLEIWAPQRTDIRLSSAGGSLEVDSLSGTFEGETGGGSITMNAASGRASLSTGGGPIVVENSDLSGEITTGFGEVKMRNSRGGLSASSRSSTYDGAGTRLDRGSGYGFGGHTTEYPAYETGRTVAGYGGIGPITTRGYGIGDGVSAGVSSTVSTGVTTSIDNGVTTTVSRGTGRGIGIGVGSCSASVDPLTGTPRSNTIGGFGGNTRTVTTNSYRTADGTGRLSTGSGSDEVYSFHKAGGPIDLAEAPNGAVVSTGGGRVTVGPSHGAVVASTGGGDIELTSVGGDAVASTGSGRVTITVVNTDGIEHSVNVCDGRGDVELVLPADFDARIELETAYTDNFDRKTHIDSDFPLSMSETNDWDDTVGTPRRYVRASGNVGAGHGIIRVQTVNGDIVVRRR